jgi:hypothetical protein
MARSLTIIPEERATTSPLFTGFLLLAIGWLLAGALLTGSADVVGSELPLETSSTP